MNFLDNLNKREKTLLGVLVALILVLLWYQVVVVNINGKLDELQTQITTTQTQLSLNNTKILKQADMKKKIEQYKSEGVTPREHQEYYNTKSLVEVLNASIGNINNYDISFEGDGVSEDSEYSQKSASISWGQNNYNSVKSTLETIEKDTYPCEIKSFSITGIEPSLASNAAADNTGASECQISLMLSYNEKNENFKPVDVDEQ